MGMYGRNKMEIGFTERENGNKVLVVKNARIYYRNLTGVDYTKYPNHQRKSFAIEVPEAAIAKLTDIGYKIWESHSKNDPDDVRRFLTLCIQYKPMKDDKMNPRVYVNAGGVRTLLDVDTIDQYQGADISHVNFFASLPWGNAGTCFINQMDIYLNEEDPYSVPDDLENEESF